jgi:hypothetical protein
MIILSVWQPPKLSESYGILVVIVIVMMTYGFNFLRTPVWRKMSLKIPETINQEAELEYAIRRLNELSASKELSFAEKNEHINHALDEFIKVTEGYQILYAKRTKFSLFSKQLLRRRVGGLMCPFFQEIIVTSEMFPEDISHEKAHLVGYARESEAQFVGYATMLNSDESLRYMAYTQRLDMLIRMFDLSLDDLKGLNKRTLMEFKRRKTFLDEEFAKNSTYRRSLVSLGKIIRSFMLRMFGEGSCENAYINSPLLMISAYDPPKK